ncbi:hypothetical protein ACV1BL_01660 [Serratia marcescens]
MQKREQQETAVADQVDGIPEQKTVQGGSDIPLQQVKHELMPHHARELFTVKKQLVTVKNKRINCHHRLRRNPI